jgi:argininosuccinate synthase
VNDRIVFAYSGAVDSWATIASIAEARKADIVTLTLDLGQGTDLEEIRHRALAAGAVRAHVLDVREEFAREYILPALHAGALHDGRDPMAAALARPLIGKTLVEIGAIEQASDVIDASGVPANLWGRVGSGYTLTKSPADAPDAHAEVEIAFERGVPTGLNGVPMGLTELIEILSIIAGGHGVGRIEMADHCGEAPAAIVLHAAHHALETFVSAPELARLKRELAAAYAGLIRDGLWSTPMREALDAFSARVQERVTGLVRITLLKGRHTIVECRSPLTAGEPSPPAPQSGEGAAHARVPRA